MEKKVIGLVGAVSAIAMMTAVDAAQAREVVAVLNARSYSELLQPIPNAVALLLAADSMNGTPGKTESEQKPDVQLAQYNHHHHHHHHHHYRRYHHHHWFHHHHDHWYHHHHYHHYY